MRKMLNFLKRQLFYIKCLLVVIALFATFKSSLVTFHTIANTDIVEVLYSGEEVKNTLRKELRWVFNNAEIEILSDTADPDNPTTPNRFTGSLEFNPQTDIDMVIKRIDSGPLIIKLSSSTGSIGRLYEPNQEPSSLSLGNEVLLRLQIPQNIPQEMRNTLVFPLAGQITVGRTPEFKGSVSQIPLLKSGTITMRSHSLFSETKYDAGTEHLDMGDQFSLHTPLSVSRGFFVVNNNAGLDIVFDGVAYQGRIEKYQAQGYTIELPVATRIMKDQKIQLFWIAVGFLLGIVTHIEKQTASDSKKNESENIRET